MWECADCHSCSHMRQDNACLPSLVLNLNPGRAPDMSRTWRYLGFGWFFWFLWFCSGTLIGPRKLASLSQRMVGLASPYCCMFDMG